MRTTTQRALLMLALVAAAMLVVWLLVVWLLVVWLLVRAAGDGGTGGAGYRSGAQPKRECHVGRGRNSAAYGRS